MQSNNIFLNWLTARKITPDTIVKFGLREENDKLVIPVLDIDGNFLFNKYRRNPLSDIGPKYSYDKGGKISLFGANYAKDASHILWTEGEMDALVAWSANIPAVSSTGGALSVKPEWSSFFANRNVTICFDNDPAGGEGIVKALKIVPWAKVLILPSKEGVKDLSDYVTHGGDIHDLLNTAKHFSSLADVISDRADRTALYGSIHFHDAYINEYSKPIPERPKSSKRVGDELSRAKEYPITNLIDIKGDACRCLWHHETEASLHYYKTKNRLWCFGGCGRGYDAIDVYMKIHGCSFKEALTFLSKQP
jgi:hypothetical protein